MEKKKKNEDIVKHLVEHGSNINKEDENGQTAFVEAWRNGNENLVGYLIDHNADINKKKKRS